MKSLKELSTKFFEYIVILISILYIKAICVDIENKKFEIMLQMSFSTKIKDIQRKFLILIPTDVLLLIRS